MEYELSSCFCLEEAQLARLHPVHRTLIDCQKSCIGGCDRRYERIQDC